MRGRALECRMGVSYEPDTGALKGCFEKVAKVRTIMEKNKALELIRFYDMHALPPASGGTN